LSPDLKSKPKCLLQAGLTQNDAVWGVYSNHGTTLHANVITGLLLSNQGKSFFSAWVKMAARVH
jgi:hypothetical protein